jgi:hypothetical protein
MQISDFSFCCATDNLNVPYVSTTNLVPIIAYGNFMLQFAIQYRQGEQEIS